MSMGNLGYIQEKIFFPKLQKFEEILEIQTKLKFSFSEFRKIDLIILPNRSNRSNPKKSLNRLDRFIGQQTNIPDMQQPVQPHFLVQYNMVFTTLNRVEGTGTPIRDCARGCNNCGHTRSQMSAIDATKKILSERLYLVPGMGTFRPWVNCLYAPTTPTVHSTTVSRFPCNCFPPNCPSFFWSSRFTK